MPELPEVETIRQYLGRHLVGKTIKNVEIRKAKIFQGNPKQIIGQKIKRVERRGKHLIIHLNKDILFIHLKLTGQLVFVPTFPPSNVYTFPRHIPFAGTELPAKTTHVIFEIDGGKLFYNDLRQFGWIKIMKNEEFRIKNSELRGEPFSKEFTPEYLQKIFAKTKKPIKIVLMDQEKIAGIGNIYANDALFEARVNPLRPANSLTSEEIKKLHRGILRVLTDGLKHHGSSTADEAYIQPDGSPGSYQYHFRVYQRDGEKCRVCEEKIKRIKMGGRGTFFCPKCQK